MGKLKEPKVKPRGGYSFQQIDVYADQLPMIQKYIEKNGGSKASVVRLALDLLLKPGYEK